MAPSVTAVEACAPRGDVQWPLESAQIERFVPSKATLPGRSLPAVRNLKKRYNLDRLPGWWKTTSKDSFTQEQV